jgi:transposase
MIRGVLKTFGLLPGAGRGLRFDRKVEALIEGAPEIALVVRPLLAAWRQLREQIAVFDKAVLQQVRADPICRLLMTVPGIGALSSLMYVTTIEDPSRFSRSRAGGAHLGLTPRRYQSGETDRSGHISRCGGGLARTLMCQTARNRDPGSASNRQLDADHPDYGVLIPCVFTPSCTRPPL